MIAESAARAAAWPAHLALMILAAPLAAVLWLLAWTEDRNLRAGVEPVTAFGESLR